MNQTIDVLMKRKSVRQFEEKEIPADVKEAILAAAMRAPTAGNSMLYSILDVTDQKLKDLLSESCDHQPFIATAPLVLVFLADYRRWVRKFAQAGCDAPKPRLSDLILSTNDAVIAAHAACVAAESFGI
ncbi:MAG: nitroreductase, partial [Acutalibacter sp.]|nr:nitroreductase [Acutalibacter sp.]